jgi:hypothetical protein
MSAMSILVYSLAALLVSSAVLIVYWMVLLPAILLKARIRVNRVQDDVRMTVRAEPSLERSRAYLNCEHFISVAQWLVRNPEPLGCFFSRPREHEIYAVHERIKVIESHDAFREWFHELSRWMFILHLACRPWVLPKVLVLAAAAVFSDVAQMKTRAEKEKALSVAEVLPRIAMPA